MRLSLGPRLFVAHALVTTVALAIVTALALDDQRRWLGEWHVQRLERAARAMERRFGSPWAHGIAGFEEAAETLGDLFGLRVTLMDSLGRVLGDSEVPRERLAEVENHADRPEVRAALEGRAGHATRLSRTVGVRLVYVAVPVRGAARLAVIRLAEPLSEIAGRGRPLVRGSLIAAVIALLLSIPLVWWVTRRHAGRVRELEVAMARLGAGEIGVRARERPADEIGRLGRSINQMAGELKARLEALERERDEREQILAHMSDGVALVDHEGRVIHANQSMAAILGVPLPSAPRTPFQAFARSPELEEMLRSARERDDVLELELRLWAPRRGLVRATATRLHGAERGSVLLVLHDLSEAELLNRVRQDFVANVSHELKTPLTSVRGYAETLLEGGLEDATHREGFVRIIRDQATRLQSLVEDLLSLAELEHPDTRLRLERFNLREAVERQAAILRDRARSSGLGLEILEGAPVPAIADRGRIEQVIANLLDNAVKYTERGSVTVALGSHEGRAWCEVRDTGPGLSEEDRSRVFERFYRVDKARSRDRGGTGLGLSIVKHILALHDGEISVESTLGVGSTFRFELPPRSD